MAFVLLKVGLLQDALVNKEKLSGGGFSQLGGSAGGSVVVTHTMPSQQSQELAGGND